MLVNSTAVFKGKIESCGEHTEIAQYRILRYIIHQVYQEFELGLNY